MAKFASSLVSPQDAVPALAYWDRDLVCRFASGGFEKWFERTTTGLVDHIYLDKLLGRFVFQSIQKNLTSASAGETQVFERFITLPSGSIKKATITCSPDIAGDEVVGFFFHIKDARAEEPAPAQPAGRFGFAEKDLALSFLHFLPDVVKTLELNILGEFPGIESLSKKHHVSPSKLKREFKKQYNCTIFEYYRRLQMELAFEYISQKKANKKQMAIMLNFSNPSNFLTCYARYLKKHGKAHATSNMEPTQDDAYHIFVEQAPVALAVVDNNLRFIAVSAQWCNEFIIARNDLTGKKMQDILPGFTRAYQKLFADCLAQKIDREAEPAVFEAEGNDGFPKIIVKQWHNGSATGGLLIIAENTRKLNG